MIIIFKYIYCFFSPKKGDQIVFFHIYFTYLCKISNLKKRLVMAKIFSYLVLWLWIGDKINWSRCTFEKVAHEIKCQRMNVNFLQPNQDESSSLVDKAQNPLKLLYFIMIINKISLPYKAGGTNAHPSSQDKCSMIT